MSGYLTNLLARSRGTAEVMRPRIASMFEPVQPEAPVTPEAQPKHTAQEREEDAPEMETRIVTLEAPQHKPLDHERPEAPAEIEQRVERKEEETSQDPLPTTVRAQVQAAAPAPHARPVASTPLQPTKPERKANLLPTAPPAREEVRVVKEAAGAPPRYPTAREQAPLTPPPRRPRFEPMPPVQKAVSSEPEVHVTIGRLEVRAVNESASRKKERPASTVMSLADYLKSRAGGGR